MSKTGVRLAGSGGQGIILASIILAEAAMLGGKNVIQSQSYGPEARGGSCRAEVILSDEELNSPKITDADILLALTDASLKKYSSQVKSGGLIVADSSLDFEGFSAPEGVRLICFPILHAANSVLEKPMTANIVALGALNAETRLVPFEFLEESVLAHVPKGTEELNSAALKAGSELQSVTVASSN